MNTELAEDFIGPFYIVVLKFALFTFRLFHLEADGKPY